MTQRTPPQKGQEGLLVLSSSRPVSRGRGGSNPRALRLERRATISLAGLSTFRSSAQKSSWLKRKWDSCGDRLRRAAVVA